MPNIINSTPWVTQPQQACEIDWSNPITRGLVFASNHATDLRNVATNTSAPTLINSPAKVSYQAGRAFNFNSGSTQGIDYGNSALLNPQAFTLFSQFQINAALVVSDEYMLLSRDDASLGRAYVLSLNGSSNWGVRAYINGGGASTLAENTQPSVGVPHTAAYSLSAGEVKLYRDGLKLASATGAGSVATTTGNTQVGKRTYSGYPGAMNGYIELSLIFNRALSDAEIKSLSANPWQIFKPIPRRIFVPVSAGGATTYTLTAQPGAYSLTGISATLLKSKLLTAQTGSYIYTGNNATLTFVPNTAIYTLTAQVGTYSYSGTSASISRHRNLTASSGAYNISGTSATILRHKKLIASTGTYNINGQQVTITRTTLTPVYTITALPGSYTLTGQTATILRNRSLTAETGAYTYAGNTITLEKYTPSSGGSLVKYLDVLAGELLILKPLGDTGGGSGTIEPEYSVRLSDASSTITYIGEAVITSLESDPVWRIKKLESLLSGTEVSLKWAGGTQLFDKVWDDRASLTYT